MIFGYTYITINLATEAIYIGQHHGDFDSSYLGSGVNLLSEIRRSDRRNFVVQKIDDCDSQAELNAKEIIAISAAKKCGYVLYNILPGGHGFPPGWRLSEETKKKIGDAQRGRPIPHREKMVKALREKTSGIPKSQSHKDAIARSKTGKPRSAETRIAIGLGQKGNKRSESFKAKRSSYMKKFWAEKKAKSICGVSAIPNAA